MSNNIINNEELAEQEAEQIIKNYCHINTIPNELRFVKENIKNDLISYYNMYNKLNTDYNELNAEENDKMEDVTGITLGDMHLTMNGSNEISKKTNLANYKKQLIQDYKEDLNLFRMLVW